MILEKGHLRKVTSELKEAIHFEAFETISSTGCVKPEDIIYKTGQVATPISWFPGAGEIVEPTIPGWSMRRC